MHYFIFVLDFSDFRGPLDSTRAIKQTNRANHNRRMKNKKHSYIFARAPRAPLTDDTVAGTRLLAGLLRIWSHLMITIIMLMMRMRKELIAGLLSIWPQLAGFFFISIISSSWLPEHHKTWPWLWWVHHQHFPRIAPLASVPSKTTSNLQSMLLSLLSFAFVLEISPIF